MGFFDGVRQGRDDAIEARKEVRQAGCRVHERRYEGCPLDIIDRHRALAVTPIEPRAPAHTGQAADRKSYRPV